MPKRELEDKEVPPTKKMKLSQDQEDPDEDIAKLYCLGTDLSQTGAGTWKLDDNKDILRHFFATNSVRGPKEFPTSKEFKAAVGVATKLEKLLKTVKKPYSGSSWFGFVLEPAFEEQEAQQAFEEALGLPKELLDAEVGLYFEDLEDDEDVYFCQDEEELEDIGEAAIKKLEKAREYLQDNLTELFTVGFSGESPDALFPEFWGGYTDDGLLVGVFATISTDIYDDKEVPESTTQQENRTKN